ncbi:hypothetical protein ACFQJC_04795 [Haloferax namakaokahaiae]|uniref:Uncharacterized protein n=1 Tax=Haloferax namakaokahaiae TaxID=1748331 RepID=A0ABD5ZC15_9EURY
MSTLTRYHEDLVEDGRELQVRVAVDDVEVSVTATVTEDVATIETVNHLEGTTLPRESFEAVAASIDELRTRGFDVDVGALSQLVEDDAPDGDDEGVEADADEDDDEDGSEDDEWCGRCGAGPFTKIGIHHARSHKGLEPVTLDHEPTEDELVGEPEQQDADEDVGDDDQEADAGDEVEASEPDEEPELPEWLERNPTDIVEDSSITRSTSEVIDAIERKDNIMQVHQRLASGSFSVTKELLSELGVTTTGDRDLRDDTELHSRIPILRAVARDVDE